MQKLDKIYYLYSPTGLGRAMPAGRINPYIMMHSMLHAVHL